MYSWPVDVLVNVLPADKKVGNNEKFIMLMLSNNFNLKHINQNITDINLCLLKWVLTEGVFVHLQFWHIFGECSHLTH